jgi:hypothetical protein
MGLHGCDRGTALARPSISPGAVIGVSLFAALCCFYAVWPIWRAFFPLEIDLKEPWNAYHSDAVLGRGTLYPELTSLIANNYPPLWYYLTGAFGWFGFDVIYVGRALSLIAVAFLCAIIVLCIRHFKATWPSAVLGGSFFCGLVVRYADWYVGMNDPNLFALAVMMLGLLWFLQLGPKQCADGSLLVMVLGGFFKHSLFAIPATAAYLLARREWRVAMRAAVVAGGAALAGIGVFAALYGKPFIDQLFFYPRELMLERVWDSFGRLSHAFPVVVIWLVWAWHDRKSEAVHFTTAFLAFSFAAYLIQKLGAGTDVNAEFEFDIALAIGVGLAFDRIPNVPVFWGLGVETRRFAVLSLLALDLLAAPGLEPYLLLARRSYRAQFAHNTKVMRSEVQRIAATPGLAWCSIDMVCRAAGKPFVIDVFFLGQKAATGRLAPNQVTAEIAAKGIRFEKVDPRAAMVSLQRSLFYGRSPPANTD